MAYTQHRLEPRMIGAPGDLLVFFKSGSDAAPVVSRVRSLVAPTCASEGQCSGVTLVSPTPFSIWELRSFEDWLLASPLRPWLTILVTTPELVTDGDPSLVRLEVRAPSSVHETITQMALDSGAPREMFILREARPYSSATERE